MDDSLDVSSTVERVKDVLYLDGDDDDVLLSSYVHAAFSFVHSAIGFENKWPLMIPRTS